MAAGQSGTGQAGRAVDVVALNAFYLARVVAATNKRSQQRQQISYNDVKDKQAGRVRERERWGRAGRGGVGAIFTHICGTQAKNVEEEKTLPVLWQNNIGVRLSNCLQFVAEE